MNKTEFVDSLAKATGQQKNLCSQMVDAVFSTITEALKSGDQVNIVGFGNFVVKHREARMGRNPKTGEPAPIAASNQASFKPSKTLKDTINS